MDGSRELQRSDVESMPRKARTSEPLEDALRQSLRLMIAARHHERSNESALRQALHDVCARARREGVHAERLLIMLKKTWREMPETLRVARRDSEEALARVATA